MMEPVSPAVPLVNELAQRRHLRLGIPFRSNSTGRTVSIMLESLGRFFFRPDSPKKSELYFGLINWGTFTDGLRLCILSLYEEEKIVYDRKVRNLFTGPQI